MPFIPRLFWVAVGLLLSGLALADVLGYYAEPSLGPDRIVFVSESDLWTVAPEGGLAQRLTAHAEPKGQPALSPDGRRLAFTGRYAGAPAVYVMPVSGGLPERLSFESAGGRVEGWTPQGEVLYSTAGVPGPSSFRVLRAVDPDNLARRELPLMDAHQAAFGDDGAIYFSRFGLALTGDNAREYRGGAMAQLWRFRPDQDLEASRLAAEHPGNLERPMWWNGQLVVLSDANGGVANLWRMSADGDPLEQLSFHTDFDVRNPSLHGDRIVYQHGADLRLFDLASGSDRLVPIRLASDRAQAMTRWLANPLTFLESARLAAAGDRVALTARGQVALAGLGALRRIEPELPVGSRARRAVISPDGRWLYAILDAGGEQEIWRLPLTGEGQPEPLTDNADTQRADLVVSPDGRHIAHWDMKGRLWLLELQRGRQRQIDDSRGAGYDDVVWSPDSRVLAVVRPDSAVQRRQLILLEVDSERRHVLTSDRYESYAPAFAPDGRWLYFLSDRHFEASPSSPWGDRNLGPMFDRRSRLYGYALQGDAHFPLAPRTELSPAANGSDDSAEPRAIDFNGLSERLFEAPIDPGNYSALAAAPGRLFLIDRPAGRGNRPSLRTIDLAPDRVSLETFVENVEGFQLSADGKRLFYRLGNSGPMYIVDVGARPPNDLGPVQVRVGDWRLRLQPALEWQQMFADAWRMQRDFLFDPALRGQDWAAIRARYEPLVERIGDRRELDDLLSQMVAELGVLHSQVRGGEYRSESEAGSPAFLGAEFERVAQGARVKRIYASDPELPLARSPLARPGVGLQVGDVITAVNGRAVADVADISLLVVHQAGQQLRLDYRRGREQRAAVVEPISAAEDASLRYQDWVQSRRERVESAAGSRIGYLHLAAMGPNDIAEFAREFYANFDREGLIIDVRRNRGGNIDSWVIEKLLRRAWMFWHRPGEQPFWNMQQSFRGHLAVLIDPLTYSDGETFAAGVKTLGLGPLIGERTAGAGVWLSDNNRLIDRGVMRAAQWPQFSVDGRWLIEGSGVAPDIAVDNLPHATWRGGDAQLDRAVEMLLQALADEPIPPPQPEAIPPRGRDGWDLRGAR